MGLLSWLSRSEPEPDEETTDETEEDTEPSPDAWVTFTVKVETTQALQRVKVHYADGSDETIEYDICEESNGVRYYKEMDSYAGERTYKSWRKNHSRVYEVVFDYKPAKQVVIENVKSFEPLVEGHEEVFDGEISDSATYEDFEKIRQEWNVIEYDIEGYDEDEEGND